MLNKLAGLEIIKSRYEHGKKMERENWKEWQGADSFLMKNVENWHSPSQSYFFFLSPPTSSKQINAGIMPAWSTLLCLQMFASTGLLKITKQNTSPDSGKNFSLMLILSATWQPNSPSVSLGNFELFIIGLPDYV